QVRYSAFVFDRSFTRRHTIALTGPPIRARVAPDGRRAALTVFEKGHSYADAVFSTKTIVIETATGRQLADLEELPVEKDGKRFTSADFNFWGVTFAGDGDHFFATLKTRGERFLVKGSIDARHAVVMRADVECPSLSPDGTLLAFKKPLQHGIGWRLHVLDLVSGTDGPLNQVRPGGPPAPQGARRDNTGSIRPTSNAASTGVPNAAAALGWGGMHRRPNAAVIRRRPLSFVRQWHEPEPESRNGSPSTGTNSH